jgi:hypothetical protein
LFVSHADAPARSAHYRDKSPRIQSATRARKADKIGVTITRNALSPFRNYLNQALRNGV